MAAEARSPHLERPGFAARPRLSRVACPWGLCYLPAASTGRNPGWKIIRLSLAAVGRYAAAALQSEVFPRWQLSLDRYPELPGAMPPDRKSVVSGKSVSVRVALGGRRHFK